MPAPRIRGYTRIPDLFMSQTRKLASQTAVDPLNTDEISSNKLHAGFFPTEFHLEGLQCVRQVSI